MRTTTKAALLLSFVLLIAVAATIKADRLGGLRIFPPIDAVLVWGYMSPTGNGDGTLNNPWSTTAAKAQPAGSHIYPLDGTYSNFTPSMTVTQPSATPESFAGTGEPHYWIYLTPEQIP